MRGSSRALNALCCSLSWAANSKRFSPQGPDVSAGPVPRPLPLLQPARRPRAVSGLLSPRTTAQGIQGAPEPAPDGGCTPTVLPCGGSRVNLHSGDSNVPLGASGATRPAGTVLRPRPGERHGPPQSGRSPTHRLSDPLIGWSLRFQGFPSLQRLLSSGRGHLVPSAQGAGEIAWSKQNCGRG
ncbi:hypothetical protein NDU88_007507 [Pleurodeles waltl]|uniref:Uncharacterized protein n=1 Tax=Pleurodeles waltl TaxID=8319 RepID=A0AAV7N4A4_PLEWA|nr:hypothetical protein NDU88_007507 [Pleurodeles waltl]